MKLLILLVLITTALPHTFGKEFSILSFEECDLPPNLQVDWNLTEVDDETLLSFTANIGDVLDMNEIKYNLTYSKKYNEKDEYTKVADVDGPVCMFLIYNLGSKWDRARAAIDPPITSCIVQPGTYELADFKIIPNKIALLRMLPGIVRVLSSLLPSGTQLKVAVDVYDGEGILGCGVLEVVLVN